MQFNSFAFVIFCILFFLIWPMVRGGKRGRWFAIVCFSLFFYGWWDWRFIFLILGKGIVDFLAALAMEKYQKHRKLFLWLSLLSSVLVLGSFKYLMLFLGSLNWGLDAIDAGLKLPAIKLTLPVGISFYTFQSMSYVIDVYRGKLSPTKSFSHFMAYLAMFPQLVAGPIIRAADLIPQLESSRKTTEKDWWDGGKLIVHGFFKKMVLADNVASVVNGAFDDPTMTMSSPFWWVIMVAFAFQIYWDFSGYSDIARGLARWMGYSFPVNFNHPYISRSLKEFWTRWHISLSSWFRDYVYYPLGGSRESQLNSHKNMWITMLVSGLWHGASWTFVGWGALHALFLSIERLTDWSKKVRQIKGGGHIALFLVFVQVLVAWVFFRATTFTQAFDILKVMFDYNAFDWSAVFKLTPVLWLCLSIGILRESWFYFKLDKSDVIRYDLIRSLEPVVMALMIAASVFFRGKGDEFIYFQF